MCSKIKIFAVLALAGIIIVTAVLFGSKDCFFPIYTYYTNKPDGYTFAVPEGFVVDESFLPDTVRFVSEGCVIEVYAQPCTDKTAVSEYIDYTNDAIMSDDINYKDKRQFNYGSVTALSWCREKLSKIENDKNHYLKIDIVKKSAVYTVFVKSSEIIGHWSKYTKLLTFTQPSANGGEGLEVRKAAAKNFNAETQAFYDTYFKNSENIQWGIYQPDYAYSAALSSIEEHIGYNFKFVLVYSELDEKYNPELAGNILRKAYSEGRTAELTLQPKLNHAEGNDLYRVLDGYYDSFLHDYAQDIAEFSHPVLFRFCNEMNGDWCEYSGYRMSLDTELYREMYRYVFDIFEQHNSDNVIWVWNPNGKSFPDFKWNSENMYYPGDGYADVLGLTLYNTGNFYEGEKWQEFDELYTPLYDRMKKYYDMPMMITEFSCARCGGNKEQWTEKMLSEIEKFPEIKVAVWWNGADFTQTLEIARAYYINDSEEMLDIFKEYFKRTNNII